jgi:hypothetical protein
VKLGLVEFDSPLELGITGDRVEILDSSSGV